MICPLLAFGFAFLHASSGRSSWRNQTRSGSVSAPIAPQSGPRRGKDYALVIGVGAYAHFPRLSNPVDDARGIAKSINEVYGFNVTLLENPTRAKIFDSIDDFSKIPFKGDDQLLVFFAGHGYYDSDLNLGYLLPVDAVNKTFEKENADGSKAVQIAGSARGSFIEYSEFAKSLDALKVQHELIILDACFAGNLSNEISGIKPGQISNVLIPKRRDVTNESHTSPPLKPEELKAFIARKMGMKSRIVLSSGDKTVPDGDPGRGSPFANRVRDALESSSQRGYLTFEEILPWVDPLLSEPVYGPILNYSLAGGFIFIRPGN